MATRKQVAATPPDDYDALLADVLGAVQGARAELVRSTNATVIQLYWKIGRLIVERRAIEGYGAAVVDRLARDISVAVPGQKGFSPRSLHYMRAFAAAWPDGEKVRQLLQFLPWGHLQTLLNSLDDNDTREWYAARAVEGGWSRGVLLDRLNAQLHLRHGAAPSNFPAVLGDTGANQDAAQALATDPYRLDFLMLETPVSERRMEDALVGRITEFLHQLGRGFAYMGRQHRLTVGERDFFVDLLFYNTHLHSYVVLELKVEPFEPEQVGKLNFYVTAIERQLRRDGDGPTIGVLLVPDKEHLVVEYALASVGNPIAVASYTYVQLPENVQRELPAADDLARVVQANQPKTRRRGRRQ